MTHVVSQSSAPAGPVFVGIDVAKDKLDLARSNSRQLLSVTNDDKGIRQIVQLLKTVAPTCIVIEATGGLERLLADTHRAGHPGQERSDRCVCTQ